MKSFNIVSPSHEDLLDWLCYLATRDVCSAEEHPNLADDLLSSADFYARLIAAL